MLILTDESTNEDFIERQIGLLAFVCYFEFVHAQTSI